MSILKNRCIATAALYLEYTQLNANVEDFRFLLFANIALDSLGLFLSFVLFVPTLGFVECHTLYKQ